MHLLVCWGIFVLLCTCSLVGQGETCDPNLTTLTTVETEDFLLEIRALRVSLFPRLLSGDVDRSTELMFEVTAVKEIDGSQTELEFTTNSSTVSCSFSTITRTFISKDGKPIETKENEVKVKLPLPPDKQPYGLDYAELVTTYNTFNDSGILAFHDIDIDFSPRITKLSFGIKDWPFVRSENKIRLLFEAKFLIPNAAVDDFKRVEENASISYSIETPQRLMFMQLQKFSFVDNTQIRVDAGQQEFSGTPDGGVFVKQPLDWPAGRNIEYDPNLSVLFTGKVTEIQDNNNGAPSQEGLSTEAIIGLIVGVVVFVVVVIFITLVVVNRKVRSVILPFSTRKTTKMLPNKLPDSAPDTSLENVSDQKKWRHSTYPKDLTSVKS